MRVYDIIKNKREHLSLSKDEINFFIKEYTRGEIPDYQASALLMAMYLNGMNTEETINLTTAMMHSGDVVDLSSLKGLAVDKHSTGGVGDTTTLVLAPLVASVGVPIAKMSGRGLGHTGGTVDKLESIPGFHTTLSTERFFKNVKEVGVAVIGQSKNIAPADKKLYALRDVTATVENISLIAASIMSKKLAAGSSGIVLDVKMGSGAFIKDIDESMALAKAMVNIGAGMHKQTIAVITSMEQPLGFAIGNALEVIEAIETLKGNGPEDLTELCLTLGAHMVVIGQHADDYDSAYRMLKDSITSGKAIEKFIDFVRAQDGNIEIVDNYTLLPQATVVHRVLSKQTGYIKNFQSEQIGICAMMLGAGRKDLDSQIDLSAGVLLNKKIGDTVQKDDLLATFYSNDATVIEEVVDKFYQAITITEQKIDKPLLIKALVTKELSKKY